MGSREEILRRLRDAAPPAAELPDLRGRRGQVYPDLRAQFVKAVGDVGGRGVQVRAEDLARELRALADSLQARVIGSTVAELPGIDLSAVTDAHELASVDLAAVRGVLGVAESGAVWVPDDDLRHRVLPVIAQHLAIVVPGGALVNDLHEAYERLRIRRPGFAWFISGPSKTADIEQALVIGAHGARSCTVFVVD